MRTWDQFNFGCKNYQPYCILKLEANKAGGGEAADHAVHNVGNSILIVQVRLIHNHFEFHNEKLRPIEKLGSIQCSA